MVIYNNYYCYNMNLLIIIIIIIVTAVIIDLQCVAIAKFPDPCYTDYCTCMCMVKHCFYIGPALCTTYYLLFTTSPRPIYDWLKLVISCAVNQGIMEATDSRNTTMVYLQATQKLIAPCTHGAFI